jgi:NADH-quinone oxidoreductase subunit M
MVPCAAAFAAGALLLKAGAPAWGSVFLAGAVLARMGIAPFHSWMPEMFEHAPLSAATLFAAPHIGAYAAARLLVPSAPAFILDLAAGAALITAVYGSGAALVQENPRRSFGFLSMSQSALILVGLDCDAAVGIVGGLVWWLASGLSLAGFCMTLWLLESRRGPMSLAEFHGGAERMPALAAGFLVLGLASVGFPGTLGFIGGELLVDGAVETFPHVGFAVVAAAGLNAVTVLRLYYFLFCGTREVSPLAHRLRVREQAALALLVGLLVGFGLYPRPLLESRARAAAEWARLPAAEAR